MRRLFVLRHAKAVASSGGGDFDRALAPRGRRQAENFGRWLARRSGAPDLAIVSPARRTRETADLVLGDLRAAPVRVDRREVYNADCGTLLTIARGADAAAQNLMLVGHNPGVAELAALLTGRANPAARQAMLRKFPTCACAILAFDVEGWDGLRPASGTLDLFVTASAIDAAEPDE